MISYTPNYDTYFLFIYAKGEDVEVLTLMEDRFERQRLIDNGYKHTATLNASAYVKYLATCKSEKEIIKHIKSLKK